MRVSAIIATAIISINSWAHGSENIYTNPIVHMDYSDPDVIRVGDHYYMTASSFSNTPGLPILHSTDLVNWKIINHALKRVPPFDYYTGTPRHGKGVWAPSLRYHNGEYYIYWGDPDFGIYMTKAKSPEKEWSEPILVKEGKGMIDPAPLWDNNGKVYLAYAWAGSRIGFNSVITICELSEDGQRVITEPIMVFDGNDGVNHTVEGPKLYKKDKYYYIFAPAGGVVDGWQLVLRSENIYGPYESHIVMRQGGTEINGPHQGALIDTPMGDEWFVHFQDKGVYGRVLHLNPVKWESGWPIIGHKISETCGEPYESYRMPFDNTKQENVASVADGFDSICLNPAWEWPSNYMDWFGFPTAGGYYRLNSYILNDAEDNLWTVPNLLLKKYPGESFVATAKMQVNCKQNSEGFIAGLLVFGYDYNYIGLKKEGDLFCLVQGICHDSYKNGKETRNIIAGDIPFTTYDAGLYPNMRTDIYLRAHVGAGGKVKMAYSLDGERFHEIGNEFQSRQGKWVGAKVGIFSTVPPDTERGWINIDEFNITEINAGQSERFDVDSNLSYCDNQIKKSLKSMNGEGHDLDRSMMPRNISSQDSVWHCRKADKSEWCSGFWPGILWYDYENTRDEAMMREAILFTEALDPIASEPAFDHDLGFIMFCSYGNAYRLTGNKHYRSIILQSADSLATLYNPKVGTILSWPRNVEMLGGHNTIMDNMINLEMLFWAAKNGGSHRLYDIAVKHAETTMMHHFRPDYTCYHVAVYNPDTGEFLKGMTHQGYSDNSTWARGQAWAIYGYTMVYRETKDLKFLNFAAQVADAYLKRLPEDRIPYWDFDDPAIPRAPRDASAAAVVASALLELQGYFEDNRKDRYMSEAVKMLSSLSSEAYQSRDKRPSLLDHSTGHHPAGAEIDASIIYADYYYLEALLRLKKLQEGQTILETLKK